MLSLSRGFTFFFGLRSAAALAIALTPVRLLLERGLVIKGRSCARSAASRCGTGPRVVGVSTAAALATAAPGAEAATATATGARHLLHLRRGVPQRRADLVDLQLDDRALFALAGLVRPLAQPSGDDHAGAPLQRLGDVLRRLPPHRAGQEQRLAVLPFAGRLVHEPRRRGDAELGDRRTGRGETQLRVVGQVADDRDGGVSCHGSLLERTAMCRRSGGHGPSVAGGQASSAGGWPADRTRIAGVPAKETAGLLVHFTWVGPGEERPHRRRRTGAPRGLYVMPDVSGFYVETQ